MPHFYPHSPAAGTPGSERATWRALESLLKSWRVFHSVAWQVPKRSRMFDGEADFVLIHPKHGMIVLEVKGGLLDVRGGTWLQRDASGGSWHELPRSPYEQAKGAMYDLRAYLERAVPGLGELPATRAVVLPAASHPGELGPDMPIEMTIAKDNLRDMESAIDRLLAYSRIEADLKKDQVEGITNLLAPTVRFRTTVGTELGTTEQKLLDLTGEQVRVLDLLRRHRRAFITGGAGTGKTVLAIERAGRLSSEGARVLLTCFNRPLGDYLAERAEEMPGVTAQSFHAFARRLFNEADIEIATRVSEEWFNENVPDLLMTAIERTGIQFDAIVIDEGQDFLPRWFMALQMMLEDPDEGPFYVFADPNQAIYVDGWESPIDGEPFPLDVNCRNTLPIAKKVAAVFDDEPASLGVEGLAPQFIVAETDEQKFEALDIAVRRLIEDEGVRPDQITVLGSHRAPVDAGKGETVGGVKVGSLGSDGLVAETIYRFKGLENDVIFVFLDGAETSQQKALAYIGMSRAKALLIVIGSKATKKALGW
ncbi:MAG: NERD domain-containing protein [Actinomycetota bacterium]